jgi:hypothetical protein
LLNIINELREEISRIDDFIRGMWQLNYDQHKTGSFYRNIEPVVTNNLKFSNTNRRKETMITRLRLGKCWLNKYLLDIKRHPTGLCDACRDSETIEHFIINCKHSDLPEKLKYTCHLQNSPVNLAFILSNPQTIDIIFTHVNNLREIYKSYSLTARTLIIVVM